MNFSSTDILIQIWEWTFSLACLSQVAREDYNLKYKKNNFLAEGRFQ